MFLGDTPDKGGQVPLQMRTGSEEVGDDDDALHETSDQQIRGFFQTGTAEFQEGGFDHRVVARARKVGGCHTDSLVGRLDSGSVGEDDDSGDPALLLMNARMWWFSSVF